LPLDWIPVPVIQQSSRPVAVVVFVPFNRREEIVSIVALLSADSIMINATAQREQANNVRAKFASSEGDHMTLLNIFRAFRTAKQNRVRVDEPTKL
jgi:hypothetical protein